MPIVTRKPIVEAIFTELFKKTGYNLIFYFIYVCNMYVCIYVLAGLVTLSKTFQLSNYFLDYALKTWTPSTRRCLTF